jgi:hypothetical protein
MTDPVIVVGAGAAGLGAATALAAHGAVTVVDRSQVPGGTAGHHRPDVQAAYSSAQRAGVAFMFGATATRWQDGRLLVCAPGAIGWHAAPTLLFAGGVRPATAAELGLVGERPAGVLPVTVANQLLESEPSLWSHVVILGDGPGADEAASLIAAGGGSVTTVLSLNWSAAIVIGRGHVTGLRIERPDRSELLPCDALLLAGDPRPVRNVDGAIADDAENVVFLQDVAAATFEETVEVAAARALTAL